jgi:alpha-galactosidase
VRDTSFMRDRLATARRRPSTRLLLSIIALLLASALPAAAATVARAGDASIVQDEPSGTWTLTTGGASLVLTLDAVRDLRIDRLVTPSGISWIASPRADSWIQVGTRTIALGNRSAGFALLRVSVDTQGTRLQLNATFDLASSGLRLVRHYAVVSGSPTFEAWTTYVPTHGSPTLSNLNALQMVVPNGAIRSVTGLMGDSADVASQSVFTLRVTTLATGGHFSMGAKGRASESAVPWIAVDGAKDEFYAALMWSGAWSLSAERSSVGLALSIGLAPMSTILRSTVDGPHVLFGVVPGTLTRATAALRSFVLDGIRVGRPFGALVTYNTWFAYGTELDEATLRGEMDRVAALGAELFVIDAGWYEGAGATGRFDFDAGLGSWTVDPIRFSNGLRPLRDHAHDVGMQFGLWVEPERVNLSRLGAPGAEEDWLATTGGHYGSDHAAQICLSARAARAWILSWLTSLIDEVQPDYLKWDNNMWVNCDREGHDHGLTDGNFAQVNGLYEILSTLRDKYPQLLIENVSGGGNRLDLGMLRYTDVAWMDDRTAPSVNVRHNVEGLSAVFPPAYLLSFVTDHGGEPLHDAPDLALYMRSRMTGVLGLCFRTNGLTEGDLAAITHEIDIYKSTRATLSVASGSLLTAQASLPDPPAWDALQITTAGGEHALISAFQSDDGISTINVKPVGLDPNASYGVESVDTGVLGTSSGHDLMTDGIDILRSPNSAAHILTIRLQR